MSVARFMAELVLDTRADLAEGPVWDAGRERLHFVDITGEQVFTFEPATGALHSVSTDAAVGCVALRASGGLVAALASGLWSIDSATGAKSLLASPPEQDAARSRFNDGKCDPQGRLWAGTMGCQSEPGLGALYCFTAANDVRRMLTGVTVSNGLAWSVDGATLYYIDSPSRRVDAFDFVGERPALQNRRTAIELPPGRDLPDGCTLDAEGMLWVAHWDGSCVTRWDPRRGELLATVQVPAPRVTSCCFGGPALDVLYITTARRRLDAAQLARAPESGGVFAVRPGVNGLRAMAWRG